MTTSDERAIQRFAEDEYHRGEIASYPKDRPATAYERLAARLAEAVNQTDHATRSTPT